MKRFALLVLATALVGSEAHGAGLVRIQEISRSAVDGARVAVEADISVEWVSGLRAVELRVPERASEELALRPEKISEQVMCFPTKRVRAKGKGPEQVTVVSFSKHVARETPDGKVTRLASLRCVAPAEANEPVVSASGVLQDGRHITLPVSYVRLPSNDPGGSTAALEFVLAPNPSEGVVEVRYRLAGPSRVEVSVHDLNGRMVRVVFAGQQGGGEQSVSWDGRGEDGRRAPVGMYFVHVRLGSQVHTRPLALVR